jgi:hypothetical protein
VSEASIAAGAASTSVYDGLRELALAGNWGGKMATVAFVFGAVALYYLLHRSRVVPPLHRGVGFVAMALLVVGNLMAVDVTAGFQPLVLLFLPIALNELFLAFWLLLRGFNAGNERSALPLAIQPI